jgi:AcrR family transcriptional regulator
VPNKGNATKAKAKKVDRRVERTRQLLSEALVSLIREKGYEAMTVQDIIDRANVGRSTFYTHFVDKDDLLLNGLQSLRTALEQHQKLALRESAPAEQRGFGFSQALFEHADEQRETFRCVVGKRSGATIERHFRRMLVDLVREDVRAMTSRAVDGSPPLEAVVQYVAGGLVGLLAWWADGKMRLSIDEVSALFRRLAVPATKAALR